MRRLVLKQYIVDTFTDKVFSGNPAAVCLLDKWLPDHLMLDIAKENNLSETAFTVKRDENYELRWFTPGGEIDLCGHATLACAFVIMNYYERSRKNISFSTKSGELHVARHKNFYEMSLPAFDLKPVPVTDEIIQALGAVPQEAYVGRDLLCVFDDERDVIELSPDLEKLKKLDGLLLQITSLCRKKEFDCVSRSFAPKLNIAEDPVCGSGYCHIIPYWTVRLLRNKITAYQASPRGGVLYCRSEGSRVILAGRAVLYSRGEIYLSPDMLLSNGS